MDALALHPAAPLEDRPPLRVLMARPRGFCAGVDRAIRIVERALEAYGAPVYVRHEIVHNRFVVEELRAKGAVFVDDVTECPGDRPLVFSAHGAPKSASQAAAGRGLFVLDATCPLVSKVHGDAERHHAAGRELVLVGHAGHVEVEGTLGQLPPGAITLVESAADARAFQPRDPERLAFVTQTTLSVDDTQEILDVLKARFPAIAGPHGRDICYATTNRQEAVKAVAAACDVLLVVGSAGSSNSRRLVEVALKAGARAAHLLDDASELDPAWLCGARTVGLTAGASAPDHLVDGVLDALRARYAVELVGSGPSREPLTFKLPRALCEAPAAPAA